MNFENSQSAMEFLIIFERHGFLIVNLGSTRLAPSPSLVSVDDV